MPTVRLEDIVERIQGYNPDADVDLLRRAYIFSAKVHQGQTRLSGESYLNHPIEVAAILANLKLDAATVAAGLLHDTIEDTAATQEEIKTMFGDEIARLVDGMTKLSRMELQSREQREAENFRKMIVAMAKDIRVILIKLADRLHNMRTLKSLPPEKQKRIAQETLDIYAPLANRLGISRIKTELEDLSFMYLNPEAYKDISRKVAQRRIERESYINELIEIMKRQLAEHGYKGEVMGRPKHFYSIYLKMQKQGISFEDVYDLIAIRIITDTKVNCYAILGLIHSLWTPVPGRFKDFIGVPKSNLYQSLHTTVIGPKGERVEFQIRTEEMHRIAEEGIAAHWRYKEKSHVSQREEQQFAWLRQLLEWQRDLPDAKEFMETVKGDLFPDVVYVFTPRGDVKELPQGSTPVDFAYSVHTDIGHQCVGAKVNGKIVPLKHQLHNGDKVEIVTQTGHTPSRDWLKFVKTSKARTRIKAWLKAEERRRSILLGKELLEKDLRKHDLNPSKVFKSDDLLKVAHDMSHNTLDDLLAAIGYGKVSAHMVANKIDPDRPHIEPIPKKPPQKQAKPSGGGMKISGMDNMLIHLSKCCNPVPGDNVVGFITRGRGVSIHTADCPNVSELTFDKERLVEVSWGDFQPGAHAVKISVQTEDKPGLLANVSSSISAAEANITHAEVTTGEDKQATLNFTIDIKDVDHLNRIIKNIEAIKGVLDVKRVKTG
ncbi:MAG TPA: bifunctional (p)ppGpp synthetase/guanosine-3',5'-bis(diphosphate) 3'-pyrophosphohydrolase [Nitrospirota bacterium]|nr:bifunctional (p)ppGpp synthetase/guanosine-3',5'-bis(diphosphate) 3'-pyrophosphohydrolase [Nitrospirota bacterium]